MRRKAVPKRARHHQNGRPKLITKMTFVTPEMAKEWLKNNGNNRHYRPGAVAQLTDDLLSGKYRDTHQGVAFLDDGVTIADGQHRLMAIVAANVGAWMYVTWGLEKIALDAIDNHVRRSHADALHLSGQFEKRVTDRHTKVVMAIQKSRSLRGLKGSGTFLTKSVMTSRSNVAKMLAKHWDAVDFSVRTFGTVNRRALTRADVMAVVARAYYHAKTQKQLKRFVEVLLSGEMDSSAEEEATIISLRNWLLEKMQSSVTSRSETKVIHQKVERALWLYLQGEVVRRVYPSKAELFPLPEEQEAAEAEEVEEAV